MLRNWLITNSSKKQTASESAEKLDESSTVDVPTKIFASSSSEDQQKANEPDPQPRQKEIPEQRRNQLYRRKYSEDFIKLGFTCILINDEPRPQCVVCSEVLSNESLKGGKLQRHIKAKHPKLIDKPIPFFRQLEKELLSEKKTMQAFLSHSEKCQKASYEVAYLIVKDKKPHSIGETLIKPAAVTISQIMHGDKIADEVKEIPLSADTIRRRISEMGQDIKCQLNDAVKRGKFSLQIDESTDVSGLAQLLVFVRYIANGKPEEDLLMCVSLIGTCTGEDIFYAVDKRLKNDGISWEQCISICTDGAGAMAGKHKGFLARVLQVAPQINFTHCIIHRENLACKTLDPDLKSVFNAAIKIVNFIKSRPLQTRLFTILCNEMGSLHKSLLLHSEVRWLSRGKVLTRLFELRDEVYLFLMDRKHELAANLTDPDWIVKLLYLSCIFEKLNSLNLSLQGESMNILTANSKIEAFKKKLKHWADLLESGKMDMFSDLNDFLEENELNQNIVKQSILNHLQDLTQWFDKYFPKNTNPERYDWILSPFTVPSTCHLSTELIEALDDLASDHSLKIAFDNKRSLTEFWISVEKEYPGLSEAAMIVLLPFGTTYLCEMTFSALSYIKNKYRSRLEVEDNLRVAVSHIKPRISLLCSKRKAHTSH